MSLLNARRRRLIEANLEVKNKQGKIVPFIFNTAQEKFWNVRTGKDAVLKLRQPGFTTLMMAANFADTLLSDGIDVATVAHKKTTDVLRPIREKLDIFMKAMQKNNPAFLEGADYDSLEYVSWSKRRSSFRITSCGGGSPVQSSTVHRLHFTEVALMEGNVEDAITGALVAVPEDGSVTLESRGCSPSGYFHDFWQDSLKDETGYRAHFIGTLDFPEYTPEFLEARRKEFRGRMHLYYQHYPETPEQAFQAPPNCYFAACPLEVTVIPIDEPDPTCQYVIGADIAEGVEGGNYSTIAVKEIPTGDYVYTWRGHERPKDFAVRVMRIAEKFNNALIAPERNTESEAVCGTIQDSGANIWCDEDGKPGIRTDANTRPILLQEFAESLCGKNPTSKLCDPEVVRECKSFCLQKSGKYKANAGAYDDLLFAHLMANYAAARPASFAILDPGEGGFSF